MRYIATKLILLVALENSSAIAQGLEKRDSGFMIGPVRASSQRIQSSNLMVQKADGIVLQISYSQRVRSFAPGVLYLDCPLTFSFPAHSVVNESASPINSRSYFVTPGLRFKHVIRSRVLLYGVLGGGFGSFRYFELASFVDNLVVCRSTIHGVVDFGGGIEFHFNKRFSFRGEVRDFVTGMGLSGIQGRHHLTSLGGIALHY